MTAKTNLPAIVKEDSAAATKLYFDTYGIVPLEFNAVDVDYVTSFFKKKGFGDEAADACATVILKQAKVDSMPVFKVLESLGSFNTLELSTLVTEVLNNNRVPTSTIGFRTTPVTTEKVRNIAA